MPFGQPLDHRVPHRVVHQHAVHEQQDGPVPTLVDSHGALRQVVPVEEIVRRAALTGGALDNQFTGGKEELFAAVFEQIEVELAGRIGGLLVGDTPRAQLLAGIDAWLEACAEPEVHRIVLIEAPAALGWERWREIGQRYGLGLVEAALSLLIDSGDLSPQPVAPLAHVLVGALDEAALYAAQAQDPAVARAEVREVLIRLVEGLLRAPSS